MKGNPLIESNFSYIILKPQPMTPNNRRFFYRIPLLNYLLLYFKIYLNNKRVKASFRDESSSKSFILGGSATIFLIFLFFWVGYKILEPFKINNGTAAIFQGPKKIKPLSPVSERIENHPKILNPSPIFTQDLQVIKKELKEIKPLSIANEKGEKDLKILNQNPKSQQDLKIVKKESKKVKSLSITTPKESKGKMPLYKMVTVDLANIREKPNLDSDIVARLGKGYMLRKSDKVGDWINTDLGEDLKGWIRYNLLEDVTLERYESWENNPNKATTLVLIKKSLEDQQKIEIAKKNIKNLIHAWELAWEAKDLDKYMSFYSKAFNKSKYNWESYKEYKKNVFNAAGTISVEIKNVKIEWNNYFLIASFDQEYLSRSIYSSRMKFLHFQLENGGWKIGKEFVVNKK